MMYNILVEASILPVYEFVVWNNCTNMCNFCWQRNLQFSDQAEKLRALCQVEQALGFSDMFGFLDKYDFLMVGGEIFDCTGPVADKVIKTYCKAIQLSAIGRIGRVYISTNLLYKNLSILLDVLDYAAAAGVSNNIRVTTSYDVAGRFHTNADENIFVENLKVIRNRYPDIAVIINTILTKQACERILESGMTWLDRFAVPVNLIPYISCDQSFMPSHNLLFSALQKVKQVDLSSFMRSVSNLDSSQEKRIYRYENGEFIYRTAGAMKCGHGANFTKYSQNGTCFICDVKELLYDR